MLPEGFGARSIQDVPDLKLGVAEDIAFRLVHQQPGNLQELLFGQFADTVSQGLGFGFLLGRQAGTWRTRHGGPPWQSKFWSAPQNLVQSLL